MNDIKLNYQVPAGYEFDNGDKDYTLYQSDFIATNLTDIFEDLRIAHENFKKLFPNEDSTWAYSKYNIFALTAPSTNFYKIYTELRTVIRSQLGWDRPLWIEAWLNYHKPNEVLDWHHHDFDYHGYISIDPKKSNTVFETYSIENKPGQIYFGPGHRLHKVEVLESFEGVRTTIGYDVHTTPNSPLIRDYTERPFVNMSLIPLI
jgi:hypothetical protein